MELIINSINKMKYIVHAVFNLINHNMSVINIL